MGCNKSRNAENKPTAAEATTPLPSTTPAEDDAEMAKIKAQQARSRRVSVANKSVSVDEAKDYVKPVYTKDGETDAMLKEMMKANKNLQVIMGHFTDDQLQDVVNALYEKRFTEGTDIIRQGDSGDCLYLISAGQVDIFVLRNGPDGSMPEPGQDGKLEKGPKVATFGKGMVFGELALMYNAPRAATVTVSSDVTAWVLNALDFKMLMMKSGQAQYDKYEGWLSDVEILKNLNHFELAKLADALETECFDAGEDIIKQGDVGENFYILEEGTAAAFINGTSGEKEVKTYATKGEYFGEVALLNSEPRKATVRATGKGCNVVFLSKQSFTDILGPVTEVLQRTEYKPYGDFA
mmetsp:Transcript_51228/g.116200  ORF Transcript_51228/g.116200 Transcript_51228/m.116200 type:complete len:351 (-) Transcript_51228:27-1079(-)